ncbi:hypothetical protein SO802_008518 [Lithocarpus litseifolius]|uniref:CC-NBS-LRR protein n=1 Tax=Lithocarpus litseifolius TaxID=425828 RepID=A0AAW2D9L0_9ROSI
MGVKPFRCLKTLWFEDLPNWVHWIPATNEGEEFPSLQELQIQGCRELIGSLPKHLGSLTKLVVFGCRKLKALIPRVPTLKEMKPHCLDALTTLPEELLGGNSCFQQLEIVNCPTRFLFWSRLPNLEVLDKGLQDLTSLETLEINYCEKLKSMPAGGLPTTHTSLLITECLLLGP